MVTIKDSGSVLKIKDNGTKGRLPDGERELGPGTPNLFRRDFEAEEPRWCAVNRGLPLIGLSSARALVKAR